MDKRVLVVVLGDLSRSPRMQYHCQSLSRNNFLVDVLATGDKLTSITDYEKTITQHLMPEFPKYMEKLPNVISLFLKTLFQSLILIYYLIFVVSKPQLILIQNPPSVPVLPIVWLSNLKLRAKLVIDWHNYGFSILSLKLSQSHPLVILYRHLEIFFGRKASYGFCVSKAMQKHLKNDLKMPYPIELFYDTPTLRFRPFSHEEKQDYWLLLSKTYPEFLDLVDSGSDVTKRTTVLFSSTSWTEDEDFGILLAALQDHDARISDSLSKSKLGSKRFANMICVITGKGPLKSYYESKIKSVNFKNIRVIMPWLPADDYPKMVASSDLGVSLHKSSSGLDLPMKVVDMLGSGIPVAAYDYEAITELVHVGRYGLLFKDSSGLSNQLEMMLSDDNSLRKYRKNILKAFNSNQWDESWQAVVLPILNLLTTVA